MSAVVEDAGLYEVLERGLSEAKGTAVSLLVVERLPFDQVTSYAFELLRVHLDTGERVDVLVKDFGASRLPKDDAAARAERELMVYKHVLNRATVGTPRLYAAVHHPVRLLLEYVRGSQLTYHGMGAWVATAAWLGAFQHAMAGRSDELEACRPLIRHDGAYFLDRGQKARVAVTGFGSAATRRLGNLLAGYERFVAAMVDQPRTLVHGSFRRQNIIVAVGENGPVRIHPVDWELAGLGSPLYDLAFLVEGYEGEELERLVSAYLRAAGRAGEVDAELVFMLDCFRLHKVLKSLGDAVELAFLPGTVDRLLDIGEALRERLA